MNIASITKLFTTTCIINLMEQGKLSLNDKLSKYFGQEILGGIHIYKGKDYSDELTVGNLLFQNTGFSDVYAAENNNLNRKMQHEDFEVSFEEYVRIAKDNKKKFAPGTLGKAHYSDLHFEMLGKIIEQLEASSLHDAFKKYAFSPLGLQNTYLIESETDYCADMYYKNKALHLPNLWRSLPGSGGCMSTSKEIMIFLKAFFGGELFDKNIFGQLKKPAMIQYAPPLGQYCGGFVRLNVSGIASFYQIKGELIGHMGDVGLSHIIIQKRTYILSVMLINLQSKDLSLLCHSTLPNLQTNIFNGEVNMQNKTEYEIKKLSELNRSQVKQAIALFVDGFYYIYKMAVSKDKALL